MAGGTITFQSIPLLVAANSRRQKGEINSEHMFRVAPSFLRVLFAKSGGDGVLRVRDTCAQQVAGGGGGADSPQSMGGG